MALAQNNQNIENSLHHQTHDCQEFRNLSFTQDLSFDQKSSRIFSVDQTQSQSAVSNIMDQWQDKITLLQQNMSEMQSKKEDVQSVLDRAQQVLKNKKCLQSADQETLVGSQSPQSQYSQSPSGIQNNKLSQSITHFVNESMSSQEFQQPLVSNIKQIPIAQFLMKIDLNDQYLQNFIDLGVYDNLTLHKQIHYQNKYQFLLHKFGIDKIGHQKRILALLDEEQQLFKRKGLIINLKDNIDVFPSLEDWLIEIDQDKYINNFELAGLDELPYLVYIQQSTHKLSDQDLKDYMQLSEESERSILMAHILIFCDKYSKIQLKQQLLSQKTNSKQQQIVQCGLPNQENCNIF